MSNHTYKTFNEIKETVNAKNAPIKISVAVAQDEVVLSAIKHAYDEGLASAILVGDEKLISFMAKEIGLPDDIKIIDEKDIDKAALIAVELVSSKKAQVLMKGIINTRNLMKAVLNKEVGLRTDSALSHMWVFEIPNDNKLMFITDGGMNIAPDINRKKQILENALSLAKALGNDMPKVAVLAANEQVTDKMPATVDAKALVEMAKEGQLPPCIIEGPIAMDVALSSEAAKHKGIASKIAGDVDIFIVPSIEVGNILGKSLVHYAKAKSAGLILGASSPIVLVSRSDEAVTKLNSIALACAVSTSNN